MFWEYAITLLKLLFTLPLALAITGSFVTISDDYKLLINIAMTSYIVCVILIWR